MDTPGAWRSAHVLIVVLVYFLSPAVLYGLRAWDCGNCQRRIGHGISILLLSIAIPVFLGFGLGAYRTKQAVDEVAASTSTSSATTGTEANTKGQAQPQPQGQTPEQKYLAENVELYDFQASYMESILDDRVPGVTFKIKNKGDRILEYVKVLVLFKDSSGSVIAEEGYLPVFISKYGFSENRKPLKPGYIW
ncbi:MAG: hypothetical protein LBU11_09180 [Zoogloeaceae bacterium]|nr:hypothetical protein [Zoogloeaceae bacterium]